MKTYIGISRDHSGSMATLARAAARTYNNEIASIKESATAGNQDVIVSVVKCGHGRQGTVHREIVNSNITTLQPLQESAYQAEANSTPLFDSVGELIDILSAVPDVNDPEVAFLVNIITDGEENSSRQWSGSSLAAKIKQLQATDRWTFVFRVPRGYARRLAQMGIPEGNILEWDQTQRGVELASRHTQAAYGEYFKQRSVGTTAVKNFYSTNLNEVSTATIKAQLVDISAQVKLYPVQTSQNGIAIKTFFEQVTGTSYIAGTAFYQLTKTESEVQEYKIICIVDKQNGAVYSGIAARDILSLPHYGTVKIKPGNHGKYDIFIQSTSVNRKLVAGTQMLYWKNAQ